MMELTFIPLKTSDGQVVGHARVQGGFVVPHTRLPAGAQAFVLTDGGYVTGGAGAPLRVSGHVYAVALHERGGLRCCGFARGCPYSLDDVRARLLTLFGGRAGAPEKPAAVPLQAVPFQKESPEKSLWEGPGENPVESRGEGSEKSRGEGHRESLWEIPGEGRGESLREGPARDAAIPFARPFAEAAIEPPLAAACDGEPALAEAESLTQRAREAARRRPARPLPPLLFGEKRGQVADALWEPYAAPDKPEAPQYGLHAGDEQAPGAPAAAAPDWPGPTDGDAPEPDVRTLLARLGDGDAAAFLPGEPPPAEALEDTAGRAADFAALLARCDTMFAKIAAGPETAPPIPFAREPTPAAAESAPEGPQRAPVWDTRAPRAADAWLREADALLARPTAGPREPGVQNPFPHIFPEARFTRESDDAGTELLIGSWQRGAERFTITAVRGEYSPRPPAHLPGFTRYIRTRQGGFWVRVDD